MEFLNNRNVFDQMGTVNRFGLTDPVTVQVSKQQAWLGRCVSLSRKETQLMVTAVGVTVLLQLSPVANSPAALPLIIALSALCWLTPVTGFFYIACAQFLPDSTNGAFAPANIGFYTWLIVTPFLYRRFKLRGMSVLIFLMPYLIWSAGISGSLSVLSPNGNWVKSILYAVMACQLANESQGNYHKCLWGLCLGALMIGIAYWMHQLGLPVQLSDFGGERAGFVRLGGVRADSVMIWPPALIALAGFGGFALSLPILSWTIDLKYTRRLMLFFLVCVLFLLPPIMSTMTMAAYAGFAFFLVVIVLEAIKLAQAGLLRKRIVRLIFFCICLGLIVMILLYAVDCFQMRNRVEAFWDYYQDSHVIGSRDEVWTASWETIMRYPWFGTIFSQGTEVVPSEYFSFYAENGYYLSHNVFLDVWRGSGLVGLILFSLFFFYPLISHLKRKRRIDRLPFVFIFAAVVFFYFLLSFPFYKTVWAFWMLMAKACLQSPSVQAQFAD